jgi:seryl-tRNA synthetase
VPRPPTAPKPVPDVKLIRDNAKAISRNCIDRNYPAYAEYPYRIQELLEETKQLGRDLRNPRMKIKEVEKSIARVAAQGEPSPNKEEQLATLRQEAQRLKTESEAKLLRKEQCDEEIQRLALALPNLTSAETPVGDEARLVRYINFDPEKPPSWVNRPDPNRSHVSVGTSLSLLDFASSSTSTGWGFYFLTNEGALLEHALVQYAISVALRRGWKAVSPPSIVYSYIAEACGFQPRDQNNEQQIWSIEQSEKDKTKPRRSLAGTAEIPLAAMYAGREIDASALPVKLVGASRCYRAEAGARGVDTKGLYRVHEFTKVEMFGWADNVRDDSNLSVANMASGPMTNALFNELLDIQTEILSSLNLPCRVLEMPTSDLGASATRKRDIEVLFPSRLRLSSDRSAETEPDLETGWGEVTSASICSDYQSRRLGTRVRGGETKDARFPHTVNGTAMAVPRVLAAILENGWDEKRGVVVVPEVLRKWMGGIEVIGPA